MDILKGVFHLESDLLVRGDVLGEQFDATIGQQLVTIHFPRLPENHPKVMSSSLLPPSAYTGEVFVD